MDEKVESSSSKKNTNAASWSVAWVVIVIGVFFLARNLGINLFFLDIDNWWALLIMAAAIAPLSQAVKVWHKEGLNAGVFSSLLSALILVTVSLLFLMHLSFFTWWPLFVIYGGLFMLLSPRR